LTFENYDRQAITSAEKQFVVMLQFWIFL